MPGDPKTYTFNVEGDGADDVIRWMWDFGDTTLPERQRSVTHTYGSQGEYVVRMSGGYGRNIGVDTAHVDVCAQKFYVQVKTEACSKITLSLSAGSTVKMIDWGDGSSVYGIDLSHTYSLAGQKRLTVILDTKTPCGQVRWDSTISLGINAGAGFEFGHVGLLLDVKNITSGATSGYKWDYGDGKNSGAVQERHQYADSGNYIVSLIALPTACSSGDTIRQSITIPAVKEYYRTEFKDRCECEATSTIGAPRYRWNGYTINADSLGLYRTVIREDLDMVNSTPQIRWDYLNSSYLRHVAIITSQRPIDSYGNFVGAAAGDWMWTIEMDELAPGIVDFSQGKTIGRIVNGNPIYKEGSPEALKPGVYFWMVYAFNHNASRIDACSRVHLFYVP